MNDTEAFENFVVSFQLKLERANNCVSEPAKLSDAMLDIEEFLAQNWTTLQNTVITVSDDQKTELKSLLIKLDELQAKTDARLRWVEQLNKKLVEG
jgi:hypothetical protein